MMKATFYRIVLTAGRHVYLPHVVRRFVSYGKGLCVK